MIRKLEKQNMRGDKITNDKEQNLITNVVANNESKTTNKRPRYS